MSFIRAAMNDPVIQRKAQEEIDRVVGNDRLPIFEDRNAMPYVTGIVWESLRWNPVAPLALAHRTTADDVYGGYYIPKGTTVIPNVWWVFFGCLGHGSSILMALSLAGECYTTRPNIRILSSSIPSDSRMRRRMLN